MCAAQPAGAGPYDQFTGMGGRDRNRLFFRNGVTRQGVTAEVQLLSPQQSRDIFGIDLIRRKVQPLVVKIQNDSGQAYRFSKTQLGVPHLPAADAAEAVYENPVKIGGGLLKRGLRRVGRVIVPVKKRPDERPVTNGELRELFVHQEIADGDIASGGNRQGFVFIRPLAAGQELRLTLVDAASGQPLVFDAAGATGGE